MDSIPQDTPQHKSTFIYALIDPLDKQVRYVGKADNTQKRLKRHFEEKSDTYKNRWIKTLRSQKLRPELLTLEEVPYDQWQERERWWIAFYREQGHPLTNTAEGGIGRSNYHPSDETRKKLSKSLRGRKFTSEHKARIGKASANRRASDETRRKISQARTGTTSSEETKVKLSAALHGRKVSPERRAKVSAALKGRRPSDITLQKAAEARKGHPGTPHTDEWKHKKSIAMKGHPVSQATKQKLSETLKRKAAERVKARLDVQTSVKGARLHYRQLPLVFEDISL